jgi:hypothetical protein
MQPYFDPTRKMTSQKNGRRPQTNLKIEDDLKKMKMEEDLNFFLKNYNENLNKKEDDLNKKIEDDLNK